jgi:hypothetical protein
MPGAGQYGQALHHPNCAAAHCLQRTHCSTLTALTLCRYGQAYLWAMSTLVGQNLLMTKPSTSSEIFYTLVQWVCAVGVCSGCVVVQSEIFYTLVLLLRLHSLPALPSQPTGWSLPSTANHLSSRQVVMLTGTFMFAFIIGSVGTLVANFDTVEQMKTQHQPLTTFLPTRWSR